MPGVGKVTVESRECFCIIAAKGNSPRLRGEYDTFLCRYTDVSHFVEQYLDSIDEDGVEVNLGFTLVRWTQAEFEAYCDEYGIEYF